MGRLVKDERNGMWAGCLAGIANEVDIDPAFLRIGFCLFTLATGLGLGFIIYIILMMCIPSPEDL